MSRPEIGREPDAAGDATSPGVVSSLETPPAGQPAGAFSGRWDNVTPKWSAERDAVLRRMYEAGDHQQDIFAALNALPGPQFLNSYCVRNRAAILSIKRPAGFFAACAARSPGTIGRMWPEERLAYLRANYGDRTRTREAIRDAINAIPGGQPVTCRGINSKAKRLGIRRGYGPGPGRAPKLVPHRPAKRADYPSGSVTGTPGTESTEAGHTRGGTVPALFRGNAVLSSGGTGARVDIIASPQPDAPPPPYDPTRATSVEGRMEKARAMLKRRVEPSIVAANARLPLREVFRLQAEARR